MPKNNEDKIIQLHLIREINRLKQKGILDEQKYKGKDGISITNIYLQGRNLIVETSDKKKHNVGPIVGLDGNDGISIKDFKLKKKDLIITTSDGKKHNVGKVVGDDGAPGLDGFTPERGVDYFTEEDIQKFVTNVIAALPEGKIEDLARDLEKLDGLARLSFNALRDVPEHLTEDGIKNLARKVTHLAAGASPTYKLDSVFVGRGKTLNIVGSGITASKSGDTITYDFSSLSGGGSGDAIVDADNDTKVEVEQSPDEDVIRGTVAGTEKFYVDDRYLVSTDTFRDAFGPIRNQESNQYLTSVYNSSGFGGAALGDIKMSTSNISIFDLSTIPSIPHSDGFHGALTDGRYIYLIPRRDSSSNQHGIIVRYDTTKSHTSASSYDYFDLETLNANCKSFIGGAYHSGYIYLANNDYGENVRYNVELPFDDSASWEVFDTEDIAAGVKGYQGIVATPTHLYYIPYSNGSAHGQLTRFDVTGDFTNSSNWEYFDMTTVDADAKGFAGGVFDGRYVYLAGFNNPNRETTIRYDTLADFSTGGSYTSFETTDINANARGYIGMSFDGRYVYYSPFLGSVAHGLALRFDSQGTFTNTSDWELFDITTVDADAKGYIGMSQDARYVYYTPRGASGGSGLVTRYDKSKTFQSTEAWEVFDLEDIQVGAGGYVGGVAIGDSVYLSPNESTYFPRIIGIGGDPNIPRGAAQILRGTDVHLAPNGFLGIGHGDPDSLTHIKGPGSATVQATTGSALLHLESTTNSYYAEILFTALDSVGGSRTGAIGMDGLTGNDNILYLANGTIQGLVVDRFGHVGRGTQTPTYQLDVEETDGSTDSVVSIVHTGNRNAALEIENSNNTWRLSNGINTGNIILYDATNTTLPFQIEPGAPDNALYIDSNGYIGINNNNPTEEVDILSDSNNFTIVSFTNTNAGSSAGAEFRAVNDGDYWFRAGISSQAADATGDVFDGGVGFIDVDGTAFNLLSRGSTGDFNFFAGGVTNSSIKLHIDGTTGYIGMGTSDPQGAWEVSGTSGVKPIIRATTEDTSYNNQLIFATGSGAPDNSNVTGIIKTGITQANPSALQSYLAFFANTGDSNTEVMRLSEKAYVGINETDPDTLVHYTGGALRGEDGTIEICQLDSSQADRITNSATSLPNFITYSSAFDDQAKVGLWIAQSWTSGTVSNANHRNFGLNAFAYLEGSTDASITSSDFNAVGGRYGVRVNDTAQAHSIAGVASYNWHQGSGTVTNSSHFLSEGTAVSVGTGLTITTLAHFRALNIPSVDGTITNQYGIYIPALSNATNNYGAYIEDNVGIGDAIPATKLSVEGAITFAELSSDPSNPAEGHTAIWQSDGTGTGDDGDLYFVTTAGATTKKIQITDFSAGTLAGGGGSSTLQQAFDLGQSITIADTDNQTLAITNNDVTNNPDTIDITNAGTGRAIYIDQNGDTGNGASTSGAIFLDNTGNPGIGVNFYDNGTTLDVSLLFMKLDNTSMDGKVLRIDHDGLGGSLIELNANNASHNDPILRINGSGTGGGQADIRIDSPNPDIELIDTDYTTPDGKYEIDVGPYTGSKSALRINSRNDADNSFEPIAYFFRKGSTGGGMAIEDGVITVGGYDVTASDGYGRILVNSDAVSPSSIDLGNSITVGTGTGGANATAKHLGNFAWMSRDSSFSAPKIVAHISVEATETYAADTDVGSRMVFYTGTDNNTSPDAKMAIEQDGQILLNNYGSGTFTGTTAKWLTVDSSGNVIEEDAPTAESFSLLGRYGTTISMGSGSLFFGLWGNHTTASATYQASYNVPIPIACTLYAISFGTTANTSDDSFDIYPVVNGTRAGSSLTVGTGNTADYVSGLSISLSAGDLLQIEIDRSNPTSGACSNGTIVFYFK